jgi:acetylornithine deacetylase/succinyl-diaminopimelate desuccinylase-like protein
LLPDDDIDEAVDDIRIAIGDLSPFEVTVERDVAMLPSVVDPNSQIVTSLKRAIQSLDGVPPELVYGRGAYDAGGPTSMGIPTVMWGRPSVSANLMGDDFVTLRGVEEEANILGRLIMDMLG